eukprot:3926099-Pyramimonas_sp.AAC.1
MTAPDTTKTAQNGPRLSMRRPRRSQVTLKIPHEAGGDLRPQDTHTLNTLDDVDEVPGFAL